MTRGTRRRVLSAPGVVRDALTGNPFADSARFLLGAGEVLREVEPDRTRRPHVHVG